MISKWPLRKRLLLLLLDDRDLSFSPSIGRILRKITRAVFNRRLFFRKTWRAILSKQGIMVVIIKVQVLRVDTVPQGIMEFKSTVTIRRSFQCKF